LAYVISLMVRPAVPILVRLGLPRTLSITVLLLGLLGATVWPVTKLVPVITDEARNLQYYIPKVESYIRQQYLVVKRELYQSTRYDLNDAYLYDFLNSANKTVTSSLLGLP